MYIDLCKKLNRKTLAIVLLLSNYWFLYFLLLRRMLWKSNTAKSLLAHIGLFLLVEIIFVLIVFREFPAVNLYTKIWIAHLIYRGVVVLCWLRRRKAQKVMTKFIALRAPMVLHLLIHVRIWIETVEEHAHGHEHHEWEVLWLVIWTLIAGLIIYRWEKLIHRNNHCETHHQAAHDACIEHDCLDCEDKHL